MRPGPRTNFLIVTQLLERQPERLTDSIVTTIQRKLALFKLWRAGDTSLTPKLADYYGTAMTTEEAVEVIFARLRGELSKFVNHKEQARYVYIEARKRFAHHAVFHIEDQPQIEVLH